MKQQQNPGLCPGAIHIHSQYSHDCDSSIETIVKAAREAGLQWIAITDHNSLGGKPYEGWHGDVLVIVGNEITPPRNHLLALNVDEVISHTLHPQQFVDAVYAQGGFGIIAHPDDRIISKVKKNSYQWEDWAIDGPSNRDGQTMGLEIWNLMSDWGSSLTPLNKFWYFFFLRQGLHGPTRNVLAWWDRLNVAGKRTFGVAGVDAHALRHRAPWGGTVEVLSYHRSFHALVNYLLLDEPLSPDANQAREQVFTALRQGRLFFANRMDGEVTNVRVAVTRGTDRYHWTIGDSFSLAGGKLKLFADMRRPVEVRLIRNGTLHTRAKRALCEAIDTPGVYRIEAYHRSGRPWLFTNPIFVT
jgi:hypothetical protein